MKDLVGNELSKGDKVVLYAMIPSNLVVGVLTSLTVYGVTIDVLNPFTGEVVTYSRVSSEVVKVFDDKKYQKLLDAIMQYQIYTEDSDLQNRILSYIED